MFSFSRMKSEAASFVEEVSDLFDRGKSTPSPKVYEFSDEALLCLKDRMAHLVCRWRRRR